MEDFFTDSDYNTPQINEYQPPQVESNAEQTQPTFVYQTCIRWVIKESTHSTGLDFGGYSESQATSTINYNTSA